MSSREWREVSLKDVILFNPRESLVKNQKAKKISMDKIKPYSKFIEEYEVEDFKGGTKFRNGDTLLARITPCLENGKTAQVTLLDRNEVGFGSTEYIVMRKMTGKTDEDYIFYLATSPSFREVAIKSMVGSSGRQRVQQDELENLRIMMPPLPEQKAIAATLSCLDDKIELNNRMNKNLEEMAQAIFKSWFVDFEPFQEGEFEESELGMIPKGWSVGILSDYVKSIDNRGKTPPLAEVMTEFPIIDVKALSGDTRIISYDNCTKYVDEHTYSNWFRSGHPELYDILISTVGSLAEMKIFYGNKGCVAQNVIGFRTINTSPLYIYQYLKYIKADLISYNIGSVQPSIKVTHIVKHKILIPEPAIVGQFHNTIELISKKIFVNSQEISTLSQIRDTLLPKLMSGEVRVPYEEVI